MTDQTIYIYIYISNSVFTGVILPVLTRRARTHTSTVGITGSCSVVYVDILAVMFSLTGNKAFIHHTITHDFIVWYIPTEVVHVQRCLVVTWLAPRKPAQCRLGAFCVHHTTMSRHFMQCHICRVPPHACLAVTCHLHFWQTDRDLLRATAVTGGRSGYRNKSQHR